MADLAASRLGAGHSAMAVKSSEFSILFPGKDSSEVSGSLEVVRQNIQHTEFDLRREDRRREQSRNNRNSRNKTRVTVTVSIGLAERTAKRNEPWAVLKAADKALYLAKKKGRKRLSRQAIYRYAVTARGNCARVHCFTCFFVIFITLYCRWPIADCHKLYGIHEFQVITMLFQGVVGICHYNNKERVYECNS